jgi:cell division protein FtsL
MAIAASIVLAPLAILNVGVKVMGAENAYAIQRLEGQIEEQTVLTESLRVENAKMASLERIKRVALDKLAMIEPNAQATIISMPGADVTSPEYASLIVKEVR